MSQLKKKNLRKIHGNIVPIKGTSRVSAFKVKFLGFLK